MRQAEAIPVTVEDDEAQKLLARLAPGLYDRMIEIIQSTRDGVDVLTIGILTTNEPEDPQWEELVFEVRVKAETETALDYWERIGDSLQDWINGAEGKTRDQLVKLVSVHVVWS